MPKFLTLGAKELEAMVTLFNLGHGKQFTTSYLPTIMRICDGSLTVQETATYLNCTKPTVLRMVRDGHLVAYRPPIGPVFISRLSIEQYARVEREPVAC